MTKQKVEIGGKWFEAELSESGEPVLSELKFEKGKVYPVQEIKDLLKTGDKFFVLREFNRVDEDGDIEDRYGNYSYHYEQIMIAGDEA